MNRVCTGSCKLLWNREDTEAFKPTRGLRQGDPLSSFLFVLCLECLSHWIKNKVEADLWKGVKTLRRSPSISHLFSADNIIIFAQAKGEHVALITKALHLLSKALGQRTNFSKSDVFFSPKIPSPGSHSLELSLRHPHFRIYWQVPSL